MQSIILWNLLSCDHLCKIIKDIDDATSPEVPVLEPLSAVDVL